MCHFRIFLYFLCLTISLWCLFQVRRVMRGFFADFYVMSYYWSLISIEGQTCNIRVFRIVYVWPSVYNVSLRSEVFNVFLDPIRLCCLFKVRHVISVFFHIVYVRPLVFDVYLRSEMSYESFSYFLRPIISLDVYLKSDVSYLVFVFFYVLPSVFVVYLRSDSL